MRFIVFDTWQHAYVRSVDTFDGEISHTSIRETSAHARIFEGETWLDFFRTLATDTERFIIDYRPPSEIRTDA